MLAVEVQGAIDVIGVDVPFDSHLAEEFSATVADCCAAGQPSIVLDLQKTPLIDSAGLEALIDAKRKATARGGVLKLSGPNSLCADILHVSGVGEQFEIFETVKSSVGSFAG
ncbi:STAS domain-containing protein [Adhaeretor mobilis]|uniref:STAS domain protein n=1 Tax=Adhaeretor mobilis TaxID=1930276 RepID=A0A517MVN8_9BACT|nr:STAS domain-containing protein [Adhaeretor mobilis]QDS98944.1 STAS domain protein [Adhaeretor mobilis]